MDSIISTITAVLIADTKKVADAQAAADAVQIQKLTALVAAVTTNNTPSPTPKPAIGGAQVYFNPAGACRVRYPHSRARKQWSLIEREGPSTSAEYVHMLK